MQRLGAANTSEVQEYMPDLPENSAVDLLEMVSGLKTKHGEVPGGHKKRIGIRLER